MSGDLLVVLGPRTRLAFVALASPWTRAQEILLITRDHGEREVLAAAHPAASIVAASDPGSLVSPGHRSVRVMCCAVGLIHPVRPDPAVHMDAAARDLRVLDRILGRCGEASVHVLKGQMTLVGNRPLPENIIAVLREPYPWAEDRFLIKAGMTGPVQMGDVITSPTKLG